MDDCLRQDLQGASDLWLRESENCSQATYEVFILHMRRQDFSQTLGLGCWIPQLLQRHFCPWMGAKMVEGGNEEHLIPS